MTNLRKKNVVRTLTAEPLPRPLIWASALLAGQPLPPVGVCFLWMPPAEIECRCQVKYTTSELFTSVDPKRSLANFNWVPLEFHSRRSKITVCIKFFEILSCLEFQRIFFFFSFSTKTPKGWYTHDIHFEDGGGGGGGRLRVKAKMRCYRTQVGGGLAIVPENWICAMTRHHVESNISILLTRNLPFDSDVRQWSYPLIIPLHVCGLNRTIERVVNLNVTWLCFDFVRSHARCDCCSIVSLHFHVVQIKQVDCKMSTKNLNNFKLIKYISWCFWTTSHTRL